MVKVRRIRRSPSKPAWLLAALIILIMALYVWIQRLYALRLHVALGYGSVYSLNMTIELLSRYAGAVVYAALLTVFFRPFRHALPSVLYRLLRFPVGILGWVIGYGLWSVNPTSWLLLFNHSSFHRADALLHMDFSFYVYQLPLLQGLVGRICVTLVLWLIASLLYLLALVIRQHAITQNRGLPQAIHRSAKISLGLGSGIFVCFAVLTVLARYSSMLSGGNGSVVYGPGFVEARLTLPVFSWVHVLLLLLVAVSIAMLATRVDKLLPVKEGLVSFAARSARKPLWTFGFYVASLVLTALVGAVVNSFYVHPNQNSVELPYIKDTIDTTRWALGIERVKASPFVPASTLTSATVHRDGASLTNVRINDQRQTTAIYNQLQSFKNYFNFNHASVDRYQSDEVYVAARQMNVNNLPVRTWINKTLVYTHGYGIAASPVNQFDQNGLPALWAFNTPQQTIAPIPTVTRPQIYFGTMTNNVIAPSKQPEFDYPVGSTDETSHYTGGFGLPVQGNRWLLALEQGTLKFFTSDQITRQSLWLFDRNIYDRVQAIAPFLRYDQDAFPFIDSRGHIEWMLDAYTSSSNIPYAQSFLNTSYIRNSVKVVMDAYSGKVTFYAIDPKDPMLASLMRVYPGLFQTQVPADIRAHFRYPSDLFQAQAEALTRYHMTNPGAFYNQEDLWAIANQIYNQNQTSARPPVYQMIRMPDRRNIQFVLTELFTPANKDNLNGWLIADNEPNNYGRLTLYEFPQSQLIFGPMQAENQIDSNPAISQQLTLWNQQGSHVVRGDLLLVPVENSLLYVEPIYLVANRQNSLPQLERVIIDFNQQVFIDNSLGAAVNDLLQSTNGNAPIPNTPQTGGPGQAAPPTSQSQSGLIQQANQLLQKYESDTAKGDFAAAGQDLTQLRTVLAQLVSKASAAKAAVK